MIPAAGTPEWQTWRRGRVGASDAPAIMGADPYGRTWLSLWREKIGAVEPFQPTPAMLRGQQMEVPALAAWEAERTALLLRGEIRIHPHFPWMHASLDGIAADDSLILEVKCPWRAERVQSLGPEVPVAYRWQALAQLCCVPAATAVAVWVWHPDVGGREYLVERDLTDMAAFEQRAQEFYAHVIERREPADGAGLPERTDAAWVTAAQGYRALSAEITRLEAQRATCREHLLALCEDGQGVRGGGVLCGAYMTAGKLDTDRLDADHPGLLAQYREPGKPAWRITLARPKKET